MNYTTIKQLAKDAGISYRNLIALAPQNDPFYMGTVGDYQKAEWFADIWDLAGFVEGVHLRRIHYWAVSREVELPTAVKGSHIYQNSDACWKYLCQASKIARYLGLVSPDDIADNKNPKPLIFTALTDKSESEFYIDLPDLDGWYSHVDDFYAKVAQPYYLAIFIEKSTMNDVLLPVCRRFNANLVTFEGEASTTAANDFVGRVAEAGKPARIFYIADFDPAGRSMPVAMSRKIEFFAQWKELDIKVKSVALNRQQVRRYRLPRVPIKDSERRAEKFEDAFGAGAVELDALEALHPGALARIVTDAIRPYYDEQAAQEVRRQQRDFERELREKIGVVTSQYADELSALAGMVDDLRAIRMPRVTITPAKPAVTENGDWLFDSQRDYIDQIDAYRSYKGGENG